MLRRIWRWVVLVPVIASAEVLVLTVPGRESPLECEAVPANWNQGLDDAGLTDFAGFLYFTPEDPSGCHAPLGNSTQGRLVLLQATGQCGSYAVVVSRAAEGGASGVVFYWPGEELGGIALGNWKTPPIRAVVIDGPNGKIAIEALAAGIDVHAFLRNGLLITDDAYEEQFIFRTDEFESTRAINFLWSQYPHMLSSSGRQTLSERLFDLDIGVPPGWFTRTPKFVPLFNPSLVSLTDGTLAVTLRMSNGLGCPSVRQAKESSMDTRIFHNSLVLATLAPDDLSVLSFVFVETPPLTCLFNSGTKMSGRQFLDEVHGPMDVRLVKSEGGELWISFYSEENILQNDEVSRGIRVAPLHVEWGQCSPLGAGTFTGNFGSDYNWYLVRDDASFRSPSCKWLRRGDGSSGEACRKSCDSARNCNAVTFRFGQCNLRYCDAAAETSALDGWQSWARRPVSRTWKRSQDSCSWIDIGAGTSLDDCQRSCETTEICDSVSYSKKRAICHLQSCIAKRRKGQLRPGWEAWGLTNVPTPNVTKLSCAHRAWIDASELIKFPNLGDVEKNWNLIKVTPNRLVIEYLLEPHIVMEGTYSRSNGINLHAFRLTASSRWPYEVLHGLTNLRGGFCCMPLPPIAGSAPFEMIGIGVPLLLGCGHLQRIRTPYDQARGDVRRFRRQAKSRTYHQFFYVIRGEPPYDMAAVSHEWCIAMNGHFSRPWRKRLAQGEEACEAIQFASGLTMRGQDEIVLGYGINDCEADLIILSLREVLSMLRPVQSNTNVSLEELGMY